MYKAVLLHWEIPQHLLLVQIILHRISQMVYWSNTSTVIADGTGPQSIFNGTNFGNLIFRNAGLKHWYLQLR